jgi:TonB family protein
MELASLTTGNLLRYFGQVLIIVAATEIGMRLVRPSAARVRLACWRLAIGVCVLLPFAPLRESLPIATAPAAMTLHLDFAAGALRADLARLWISQVAALGNTAAAYLPWLLFAGILARAAWLGLGFVRLARLRKESHGHDGEDAGRSQSLDIDVDLDALKHALARHADVRWHDATSQPVTFGVWHPIVLLPRRVADLPREAQRAILCHELLHVARRDWAWMLAEEALRTALWWHPAIWWALAQVHLHREETIDAQVVAITAARQPYMRALIAFADATPPAAPIVPFIRRRHLAERLEQLVQEVPVSRMRLTCAAAAVSIIIAGASWASVSAMPLREAAAQPAADEKPIKASQADRLPRVITEVKPVYPKDALLAKAQGELEVEAHVAKDGSVMATRITKSIPALDKAATDAIRQWKFEPSTVKGKPVEVLCRITVRFALK